MKINPDLCKISSVINLDFKPEDKKRRKEKVLILNSPLDCPESATLPRKYECEVFNFLLDNMDALGIQTIFMFANLRVDGAILLVDGKRLAIEIKLRMSWKKALEAGYEFRRFLLSNEAQEHPVDGAIVFFEEFKGSSWHKQPQCRFLENGWNEWYRSHCKYDEYRLDLFRIRKNEFEHFGLAMLNRQIANMSAEERERLAEMINLASESPKPPQQ
jgi:hypothetical protein